VDRLLRFDARFSGNSFIEGMETMNLTKRLTLGRRVRSNGSCGHWAARWELATAWLLPVLSARAATTNAPVESAWLGKTLEGLTAIAGDWVMGEAFGGFTWGQLFLSGAVLVLVAAAAQVLRWMLRRIARRQDPQPTHPSESGRVATPWSTLVLESMLPPLTLFIWIWGVYAAFALLFAQAQPEQLPAFVLGLLGWLKNAGEIAALFWFIFRMIRVVEVRLTQWAATTQRKWDDVIVVLLVRALRLVVPLVGVILIVPTLNLPPSSHELFKQAASLVLIGAVGFILYQLLNAVEEAVLHQFRIDVKDNLEARKVYTQVKVLKKIAVVVVVLFTAASMLMVFDSVRQLGTSILASAGVLGIIVGFAAQRSIATVLAGFQIALTQPIRLDDVVIVEGEWGRIEEITLTYVVVLIWDQRRLIVPISYFIEKPFQNWTRVSADLLGSVFLYVDYTVPLKALRDKLDQLLDHSKRWDRKVKVIQVTDAKPNGMEVRVLVSAPDASTAWDLRCELREKLIDFLQRNYPQCLPRMRAELVHAAAIPDPNES
jgi:small-conductance mechanosensitive channel